MANPDWQIVARGTNRGKVSLAITDRTTGKDLITVTLDADKAFLVAEMIRTVATDALHNTKKDKDK